MQLVITLKNINQLEALFQAAPAIAQREYMISLERIALNVEENAKKNSPVGKYTGGGNLRQSIRTEKYGTTGFQVIVNATYGVYVDQGTSPHIILPKRGKYLVFTIGGRKVFARRVNHPGTKPTYFFTNAVQDANRYADIEMAAATQRVISLL